MSEQQWTYDQYENLAFTNGQLFLDNRAELAAYLNDLETRLTAETQRAEEYLRELTDVQKVETGLKELGSFVDNLELLNAANTELAEERRLRQEAEAERERLQWHVTASQHQLSDAEARAVAAEQALREVKAALDRGVPYREEYTVTEIETIVDAALRDPGAGASVAGSEPGELA